DQSINQCKITKNLSQNVVHSDSDLILHNSSVLIDKEPNLSDFYFITIKKELVQNGLTLFD
ncbi:hypothetical protein QQ397_11130, partial [Enterococcus faecium]|nr:hypothetical protein [Enterococcus faecium]MDW0326258.1 hypothetical protein [Enterococcus faecium]